MVTHASAIIISFCILTLAFSLRAYVESQRTILWYKRKRLPMASKPPKASPFQKVMNVILFLPPNP